MTDRCSAPHVRVLSAAAAVFALAATMTACGEESAPQVSPHVSPQATPAQPVMSAAEKAAVRADLRNLATFEETFFVDHGSYTADVAALRRVAPIRLSEGATFEVAVDEARQLYCIRGMPGGSGSADSTFTYSSDGGGLSDPGPVRGWCAEAAADDFTPVAGPGVKTYAPEDGSPA